MERLALMAFLGNAAERKAVSDGGSIYGYEEPKSLFRRNQVGRRVLGALELCSTEGKPNVKVLGGRRKRYTRASGFRIGWCRNPPGKRVYSAASFHFAAIANSSE
jgi:hypothetical protein